jgi:hypothetical protein
VLVGPKTAVTSRPEMTSGSGGENGTVIRLDALKQRSG